MTRAARTALSAARRAQDDGRPLWKRHPYPSGTYYEGYMVNNKREVRNATGRERGLAV